MRGEEAILGVVILGVFAALFVLSKDAQGRRGETGGALEKLTRAGAILLPFAFGLFYAGRSELGPSIAALAALMALLSATAVWIGPRLGLRWLGVAAAGADLAVVLVWIASRRFEPALAWEAAVVVVGLALAFHLPLELRARRREHNEEMVGETRAALLAAAGLAALSLLGPGRASAVLWPWLVAWIALASILGRQAMVTGRGAALVAAAVETGLGLGLYFVEHGLDDASSPGTEAILALTVALAIGWQLVAAALSGKPLARSGAQAAGIFPCVALLFLFGPASGGLSLQLFFGSTLLLGFLGALGFTRLRSGLGYALTMALLVLVHWSWSAEETFLGAHPGLALLALAAELGAVVLFTTWPFLARGSFRGERLAWSAAALAGPAWFLSLLPLWRIRFGEGFVGVLPVLLASLSLGAALRGRSTGEADDPQRRRNLVWFSAVALAFVSVAIPLQLEKEWITLGWAVVGAALIALWRKLDHPGLKYFALALLAAAAVRLVANPALLGYHAGGGIPVLNWLLYTYLVPAASLLAAAAGLSGPEVERARPFEAALYASRKPIGAVSCAAAAILVVFAWVNLTIFDAYSASSTLTLTLDRLPARDLTLSLAWAAYALVLLAVGMRRRSSALRWVSLAFLVITIGKVFLYDLGELEDLYRVASLVGLALSLLAVSLAYQRFVFGRSEKP